MEVLLYREKNLVGIDGLYEIVGDFIPDGLIHYVLFFALGYHDHGNLRSEFFYPLKRFESCQAGHILVEDNEVERLAADELEGVAAVVGGNGFVTLRAEEQYVGLQKVYFVVGPEDCVSCGHRVGV